MTKGMNVGGKARFKFHTSWVGDWLGKYMHKWRKNVMFMDYPIVIRYSQRFEEYGK